MAFGTFASPGLPAGMMAGTQAPQKLFGDIPAGVSQIPGMVTPQTTVAMPSYVDLEGVLNAQNKQKALSQAAWARAAAMNAGRAAQSSAPQGHYLPGTQTQSNPQHQRSQGGSVLWAPRGMSDAAMGTWETNRKSRHRQRVERHDNCAGEDDQPFSPGELGGGSAKMS
jgi:hypothetical protein